ncbi:MAG: Trm112 family protein [Litorilinea sp.]
MKKFIGFLFRLAIFAGFIYLVVTVLKKIMAPAPSGSGAGVLPNEPVQSLDEAPLGGAISDELLRILVCPEDKGPLELVDDGKFLLNPRNGYKYPIRNGIPVMLIEEGKKFRDESVAKSNGAQEPATAEESA